ncbi:sialidase family protein [Humibacter ginsengiterrae]
MGTSRRTFLTAAGLGALTVVVHPAASAFAAQPRQASGAGVHALAVRSSVTAISAPVGYCDNDLNPMNSTLSQWGVHTGYAVDYEFRSLGVDLGTSTAGANALLLQNLEGPHGLNQRDFSVYTGSDNQNWSKITDVQVVDLGDQVWLLFALTTGRYLKVHCHREFTDVSWSSFILSDLQTGLAAYSLPLPALLGDGGGSWSTQFSLTVQNSTSATLTDQCAYVTFADLGVPTLVSGGQLRSDLADLRFADVSGNYVPAYADTSGVFLRIAQIAPGATQTLTAYTGNTSAHDVVHSDASALQVEYGQRSLVRFDQSDGTNDGLTWGGDQRPMLLASGVVVVTAGWHNSTGQGGIGARYSHDGGRTFGSLVNFVPGTSSGSNTQYGYSNGSYIVDPSNGTLHYFFFRVGVNSGSDWLNPADHDCTCWVATASTFGSDGSPNFTSVQQLVPYSASAGKDAAWSLTYANPVITNAGTWLVPVWYAYTSSGSFAATIFRSTDRGTTWNQVSVEFTIPGSGLETGVSESALAISPVDGSILFLARAQAAGRYYLNTSHSSDDGQTWSALTQSDVLSSNTMPAMSAGRPGDLQLSWSGHNSKGQSSYWRNNLTMAYSEDGGTTWEGYHDLIGATSLSVSGINAPGSTDPAYYYMRVMEADSIRVGDKDRLFGWSNWNQTLPDAGPYMMYLEDEVRYLRNSHGALDLLRYTSTVSTLVGEGSEMAFGRWLRDSEAGSLSAAAGAGGKTSALRMQGPSGSPVGASRLYPAIRKGRIRMLVNPTSVGAALDISVQEGFGSVNQATGTLLCLRILPTGQLLTAASPRGEVTVGYLNNDTSPATGNLANFGYVGNIAFDYQSRSIGSEFSSPATLDSVSLTDTSGTTRLTASDLSVWVSNTNGSDWRQLTDWTVTGSGGAFTASGPAVTTRYLKVHQTETDTAYTFVNDISTIMSFERAFVPLQQNTVLPFDEFSTIDLGVDTGAQTVTVTVDGTLAGTVPQFAPAAVTTHLFLIGQPGSATTDVTVDQLLIQDLSAGVPAVTSVGQPQPMSA